MMSGRLVSVTIATVLAISCSRSPRSYVDRGDRLFAEGKYADAALNYRKAIQKDAGYGLAYFALGKLQLKQHEWAGAYQSLLRASELLPDNKEAKIELGDLAVTSLIQDRNHPRVLYDKVSELANSFLAKKPDSFDGLRWQGYLAMVDRKPSQAVESFSKAHRLRPSDDKVRGALVQSLFQAGRDQEAEKLGLEGVATNKQNTDLYDVLYLHYRESNQTAEAESILKRKVANNPQPAYILELAAHYYQFHNLVEMKRVLADFSSNVKLFPLALLQAGDFYAKAGMQAEAIRSYEQGAKTDLKNVQMYQKRLANLYLAGGRTQDARAIVDEILRKYPKDAEALSVRASLDSRAAGSNNVARSVEEFQSLLKERPSDPVLRFGFAQALMKEGDLDGARKEYQAAVKLQPRAVLPHYALADLAVRQHNAAELLRQSKELLSLEPNSARAGLLYGMGLVGTGQIDAARNQFHGMLRRAPTDEEVSVQLALLEIQDKHFKEAEAILKKAGSKPGRDASAGLLQAWARLRIAQGQPNEALRVLRDAVRKQPGDSGLRLLLAKVASAIGEHNVAIEQYKDLLGQAKSLELYSQLGKAQEQAGDYEGALVTFREMKQFAPNDASPELLMGGAYEQKGRSVDAIQHYNTALQLDPHNSAALNNLAFLLADSGTDLDRALQLALAARQNLPDEPGIADTVGYAYLKKNMTDSALQVFGGLVLKFPSRPTYRYHYALALLEKGHKDEARKQLNECLKESQPQTQTDKITALLRNMN